MKGVLWWPVHTPYKESVITVVIWICHGLLARYVKLRVAHAPGMSETFCPAARGSDPDMHHGTCVTHVPWYMPGSPTSGFHWSRWPGKRSRHSRRMRNPQFYVSDRRPMTSTCKTVIAKLDLPQKLWGAYAERLRHIHISIAKATSTNSKRNR